jgi:hypothetical protein
VGTSNISLIKHLKKQPKHGMADEGFLDKFNKGLSSLTDTNAQKFIKDLNDGFDEFLGTIIKGNDYITEAKKVLQANVSEYEKLSNGVGRALTVQNKFNTAVLNQIKNTTYLETANSKLNKSFGMSSERAYDFSKRLRNIGVQFSSLDKAMSRGDADLMKYAGSLKSLTGGMIASSKAQEKNQKELLTGQSFLQDNMALTETQAQSFELYASNLGQSSIDAAVSLNKLAESIATSTGLDATQVQSDLLEGISDLSSDIQAQYSRIPGNLEVAVLKARALGTSMEKLSSIGSTLLNIESSIGSELEYQQLTGRRLLTDQGKSLTNEYRMATVRGDGAKQAALMAEFVEKEGDSLKNNMYARKKAAELFGVQETELLNMVNQRKLLAKYDMEDILKLSEVSTEQIAKDLKAKGASEKEIQDLFNLRDTKTTAERSEKYLQSIDSKILGKAQTGTGKEFVTAMRDAADAPLNFANKMSETFGNPTFIKGLGALGTMSDKIKTIVDPVTELASTLPGLGTALSKLVDPLKKITSAIPAPYTTGGVTELTDGEKASGGPVVAGSSYLVGERGPEIVSFRKSGRVTPTNQTKSMLNAASSINYAALGAAVAQALQSTPIYATLVTDNLYGSTSMNGKKQIG